MVGKNEFRYVMRRENWNSVGEVGVPAKGRYPSPALVDGAISFPSSVAARSGDQHVSIAKSRQGSSQRKGRDTSGK
jgi:hypothetical protein